MNPLYLPDQIDRMAQRQKKERLAYIMTGLAATLLAVMALKECRGLLREDRGRSR